LPKGDGEETGEPVKEATDHSGWSGKVFELIKKSVRRGGGTKKSLLGDASEFKLMAE